MHPDPPAFDFALLPRCPLVHSYYSRPSAVILVHAITRQSDESVMTLLGCDIFFTERRPETSFASNAARSIIDAGP